MKLFGWITHRVFSYTVIVAILTVGLVSALLTTLAYRSIETGNDGGRHMTRGNCSSTVGPGEEIQLSCEVPDGEFHKRPDGSTVPVDPSHGPPSTERICIVNPLGRKVCFAVPGRPLGGPNSEIRKAITDCARLGVITAQAKCTDYEAAIENLSEAPLAYNRPASMTRGEAREISLVLDLRKDAAPAVELRGLSGEIVEATTKVSRHMSAQLRGVAFEIDPKEPQERLVTAAAPVQWSWAVKPVKEGEAQLLTLEVHAHIEDGGAVSKPIKIRTFKDEILVEVTTWDQITDVAAEIKPVHALGVAVVGSAWGLFMFWRRKKWRLSHKENDRQRRNNE